MHVQLLEKKLFIDALIKVCKQVKKVNHQHEQMKRMVIKDKVDVSVQTEGLSGDKQSRCGDATAAVNEKGNVRLFLCVVDRMS